MRKLYNVMQFYKEVTRNIGWKLYLFIAYSSFNSKLLKCVNLIYNKEFTIVL